MPDDTAPKHEGEQAEYSRMDRLIMSLPDLPRLNGLRLSTLVWIALGVSHGAWLIENSVFPADYVIWGAIIVAAVAGVMQRVE